MALPSEVVLAGLDGEPVPRYDLVVSGCTEAQAKRRVRELLKQAGAVATKTIVTPPGTASPAESRSRCCMPRSTTSGINTFNGTWSVRRAGARPMPSPSGARAG